MQALSNGIFDPGNAIDGDTLLNRLATLMISLLAAVPLSAQTIEGLIAHPQITFHTTEGEIVIELDTLRAPYTVAHFVELAEKGHFDGTMFHRVVRDFVVQGGGYDTKYEVREDETALPNESGNGLSNRRGTLAMARTSNPHSANSQFFFNLKDNTNLDPQSDRWGYTVFAKVVEGMSVVDTIGTLPTGPGGPFKSEVPNLPVVIEKTEVMAR